MDGPLFLVVYGATCLLTLAVAYFFVQQLDDSARNPPPPIPTKPNALQVAYLRGGAHEVIRLLIFDLTRKGYLQSDDSTTPATIHQSDRVPDLKALKPQWLRVYETFEVPQPAAKVFTRSLVAGIEAECSDFHDRLREEGLIPGFQQLRSARTALTVGSLVILGLGGYKLAVALRSGHSNVVFLIIGAVASIQFLNVICSVPPQTQRGRRYLDKLRQAFSPPLSEEWKPDGLVVAVFGLAILQGTDYVGLSQVFAQSTSSGGVGGCGSGGSSGSGDGGGGGCGGCGGG